MKWSYYEKLIPPDTKRRSDVTPLFSDANVFSNLIDDLICPFRGMQIDQIVGIDSIGFVLAGATALRIKKPLVVIRKGGKLPLGRHNLFTTKFSDHSKSDKSFEMNRLLIRPGDRILIVDDWIETGSQMKAAIRLIERAKGHVVGDYSDKRG
jgi:adenine phosphoribosyltransferase